MRPWLILSCLLAAGVLTLAPGCQEDEREYAPWGCITQKPDSGTLTVNLTINRENPSVLLALYRGDFERDDVILREMVSSGVARYEVPIDHYYSVTARYITGSDTTVVVDGASIDSRSTEYRDATCWETVNAEVDVRLNF